MSKKFSQFAEGDIPRTTDIVVGLRSGINTKFNFSGVNDQYGNKVVEWNAYDSLGRNYISFTNSPAGVPVAIEAEGVDADVSLTLSSKANGDLNLSSPNAGDVNIIIGGAGDINMTTNMGKVIINETTGIDAILDEDDMSSNSATAVPTQQSVKAYVDAGTDLLSNLTYITKTNETADLPNSFALAMHPTGFLASTTGTGNVQMRSFVGTSNQIDVANSTGLLGNPTFSLPLALTLPGSMTIDNGELILETGAAIFSTNQDLNLVPDGGYAVTLQTETVSIQKDLIHELENGNKLSFTTGEQTYYIGSTEQLRINNAGLRVKSNLSISDSQISTATGDLSIVPFDDLSLYGDGDIDLLAGLSGGVGDINIVVNGSGALAAQTNSGNITFDTTSGAYNFSVGGSSIMDLSGAGFRLGASGTRVTSISSSASASGTVLMDADAIQLAIANQIGSAKSFRGGYDASTNLFPTTGGSGVAGAVKAGDVWVITVAGTLGGTAVSAGDTIIALVDTPGQTAANWSINANGVATWNGRAGVVTPLSGDYSFSLISGTAAVSQGGTGATSVGASGTLARSTGSAYGFTTATYPSTIASNDLLRGSATNVITALSTQNSSILTTSEFGALRWTNLSLGQVPMGSFVSGVNAGTITGGTGMGTNFSDTNITIELDIPVSIAHGGTNTTSAIGASGTLARSDGTKYTWTTATYPSTAGTSGNVLTSDGTNWSSSAPTFAPMTYNAVTASTQALAINNAYYTTYAGLSVMTIPSTAARGSIIRVRAGPSGNTFKIAQNAGQLIYYGAQSGVSLVTTTGTSGYLQSVDPNTTVDLECIVADTTWMVVNNVNSLTVA